MSQVLVLDRTIKEEFQKFLDRGKYPYDYERILLGKYADRVFEILKGGNPPPYEIEIQPSSKCNAHCIHCWARYFTRLDNNLYSKEAMDRVINQVLGFRKNGFEVEMIKFCGSTGEPLLNPYTLYAINELHGKKYLTLFTNGIRLAENKDNLSYLKTLAKINSINLSLDAGTTETLHKTKPGSRHVTLEHILEAVKKVKLQGNTEIIVSYVITNKNYWEIVEATKKTKETGVDRIRFRIDLTDRTVSKKHSRRIIQELEKAKSYEDENFKVIPIHSEEEISEEKEEYFSTKECGFKCFTCKLWSCIGANGCLYSCGHIVSADTKNYGSLLEENLANIWESEIRRKIISELPIGKCSICSPFSLRINRFLTFLSPLDLKEIQEMCQKQIRRVH